MKKDNDIYIVMLFALLLFAVASVVYLADRIDKMDARITNIEMAK
jgi:hypothetical protein